MHAERLLPNEAAPEGYAALRNVEVYLARSGLPKRLIDLVKMRSSQINGCAYCLDVHAKDARKAGETEQRLYLLTAWRESQLFSPAERAALAWTEALQIASDSLTTFAICYASLPSLPLAHGFESGDEARQRIRRHATRQHHLD